MFQQFQPAVIVASSHTLLSTAVLGWFYWCYWVKFIFNGFSLVGNKKGLIKIGLALWSVGNSRPSRRGWFNDVVQQTTKIQGLISVPAISSMHCETWCVILVAKLYTVLVWDPVFHILWDLVPSVVPVPAAWMAACRMDRWYEWGVERHSLKD